jgi:tetratricopeptide (TPR) repeat protein
MKLDKDKILNEEKNISALINKGTVLHTMGKYSEAISCYDIVLRLDERNTMANVCKGLSLGEMGNIKSAIKYFKKALSIDSQHQLAQISFSTAKKS